MFTSRVMVAGIAIVNSFLLARLIGPEGKGDFYLIAMIPTMLMVLVQLGLPQAFAFYSARGETRGLIAKTLVLSIAMSALALAAMILLLPALQGSLLRGIDAGLIVLALLVLPPFLNGTFTTGIVIGRSDVRSFATTNIASSLGVTVGFAVLVGVLGMGVLGAVLTTILSALILFGGRLRNALRLVRQLPATVGPTYRQLGRFGITSYPGSVTTFFSTRIDVLLIAWLLADASAPLGFYSLAVSLAEIVFFLPDVVATLFFPHVAGSKRHASDRQVPVVARVTLLVTLIACLAVVPGAAIVVTVILPSFGPAWLPFLILIPGVVALSVGKILSGYLTGLGRTGLTSAVHLTTFAVNLAANLALIPPLGIAGAAIAAGISYLVAAVLFSVVVVRVSGARLHELWLPQAADVRLVAGAAAGIGGRLLGRLR